MPKEKYYLTKETIEKFQQELNQLEDQRMERADRIREALEMGDLGENEAYRVAKENSARTEARIKELREILKHAIELETRKNSDSVEIGSTIKISGPMGVKEFLIVDSNETDPLNGRMSYDSPLGKQLLGKRAGDEIVLSVIKDAKIKYKILEIEDTSKIIKKNKNKNQVK